MKILMAVHHFPPTHASGGELLAYRTARWLITHGHQVRVVCVDAIDDARQNSDLGWRDQVYDEIPVRRLSFDLGQAANPLQASFENTLVEAHLNALVKSELPDLVYLVSGYLMGLGPIRAARCNAIPRVIMLTDFWFLCPTLQLVRGDGSLCPGPEPIECARCLYDDRRRFRLLDQRVPALMRGFWRVAQQHPVLGSRFDLPVRLQTLQARGELLRAAMDSADAIVAPTRFIRDLHTANGLNLSRCSVVPYSINVFVKPELPARANDMELRIGYLGQVVPIKGVDVLVRAFRRLDQTRRHARLTIHGPLEANPTFVRDLGRLADGDPNIIFAGRYEHSQLLDILSELDVVVVPSIWYENAPHVILEAFAAQRPVVGTNLGGIAEVVTDEVSGLLFARGDATDLARQLQRLLDEPALLPRLRQGIPPVRTVDEEMTELMHVFERVVTKPLAFSEMTA